MVGKGGRRGHGESGREVAPQEVQRQEAMISRYDSENLLYVAVSVQGEGMHLN